ncbi:hypothetical protein BU17DRAFT_77290 [Hysterangium stoloniferum]|nr:hypothetical protein BU17DRAFT_77290 [Hysterangium stoloniferum]
MATKLLSLALLALPILSNAQLVPTAPGPGGVFKEGGPCSLAWTVDTTGQWKHTFIELMDGPNDQMHHLATVAQIDGTDPTKTSLTITCPKATAGQNTTWTTRFTIADANGASTPPANAKQPNGDPVPWGVGQLIDTSNGSPPPPTAPPGQVDDSTVSGGGTTSPNSTSPILTAGIPSSVSSTASVPSLSPSSMVSVPSASFGGVSPASSPLTPATTTSSGSGPGSSSAGGGGNGAVANSMSAVSCVAIAAIFGAVVFY